MDAENVLLTTEDKVRDITFSLVDLSDVTRFEVTSDEIHRIADVAKRIALLAPHIVVAVIAPGDYVFGLARMWETLVESTGWTTAVVRSKAEADAWVKTKLVTQCEE